MEQFYFDDFSTLGWNLGGNWTGFSCKEGQKKSPDNLSIRGSL